MRWRLAKQIGCYLMTVAQSPCADEKPAMGVVRIGHSKIKYCCVVTFAGAVETRSTPLHRSARVTRRLQACWGAEGDIFGAFDAAVQS